MQVRTFTGTSASNVRAQIKAEMGSDVVILSSRDCSEGGRKWHETTVGIERSPGIELGGASGAPIPPGLDGAPKETARGASRAYKAASTGETRPAGKTDGRPVDWRSPGPGAAPSGTVPPGWDEWHRDWNQIKDHLLTLMKPELRLDALTPRQRLAVEYLGREGMDDSTLFTLYKSLAGKPELSVLEPLSDLVPVRPWGLESWPQEIHVLAGPFGAGKTTCALRLALTLRKEDPHLPILFLNADSERAGGRLLLRHYAELSAMEYAEAGEADQCLEALRAWSNENGAGGKVIVDLPGAGRGQTLADQLERIGLTGSGIAVHLTLSPLSGGGQQAEFLRRYRHDGEEGGNTSIIWTKLDEASGYGAIINAGAVSGLPICALSYGPGITDTLVPAYGAYVWRLIFKHQFP